MDKPDLPYEEWPEKMKILTAFRIKSFTINNPNLVSGLSITNVIVGLLCLIPAIYLIGDTTDRVRDYNLDLWMLYIALLNLVIGAFNFFFSKNAVAWIRDNSSWEERDKHTSDNKYKLQYFLIMLGIIVIPWLIACLICC